MKHTPVTTWLTMNGDWDIDSTSSWEYHQVYSPSKLCPEKQLMAALVEDAVNRARSAIPGVFREAREWIDDTDEQYLFSFANCCRTLGWNPVAMRRRIQGWYNKKDAA